MSYEGYMQRWCPDGHCWNTTDLYHVSNSQLDKDVYCPFCGQKQAAYGSVDDTNCESVGKVHINDRLPTVAEMRAADPGHYWHRDILDDPEWAKGIEAIDDPLERMRMYAWAASGD